MIKSDGKIKCDEIMRDKIEKSNKSRKE